MNKFTFFEHGKLPDNCDLKYYLGIKKVANGYQVENNIINSYNLLGSVGYVFPKPANIDLSSHNLFEYQIDDILQMCSQRWTLNANPMGYGKTVETIITLQHTFSKDKSHMLIVAPKAILQQWAKEIEKWWPERAKDIVILASGGDLNKRVLPTHTIFITNYEHLIAEKRQVFFQSQIWGAVVLDECHRIKNRKSLRTKAAFKLKAKKKILLSGTPVLRRIDDLWAQLRFLDYNFSGNSYWNFVEYFCEVSNNGFGKEIGKLKSDPEIIKRLNYLLDIVAIRNDNLSITKGKQINIVNLKMGTKQKRYYTQVRKLVLDAMPESLNITSALTHLLRLRQMTSVPQLHYTDSENIKFEWIRDLLLDNPEEKIVVFSNWRTVIEHLHHYLSSIVASCLYHGGLSTDAKLDALSSFLYRPEVRVLAGTIGSLGLGVNGLQKVSSTVIFLDRDWSPELNAQAEDRLNRIGQENKVNVYYLECIGSIDRKIATLNASKAADIKSALSLKEKELENLCSN